MRFAAAVFLFLFNAIGAAAAMLPGFRLETVTTAEGFVTSVVTDSRGTVYFTTTDGWIHRVEDGQAVRVAALPTRAGGNGGLLGMALLDDETAVVHYTTWLDRDGAHSEFDLVLDDVIARVTLANGAVSVIRAFPGDVEMPERGVSSEHHGGNPIVAPDGSVFVGIGEYGEFILAQKSAWNGGKIWRIDPQGNATQWAIGMRNPYDLAWDPELERIVVGDNGPNGNDEVHVIDAGANCGWPYTVGSEAARDGMVAPDYVFPETVAPTGLLRLDGTNPMLRRGYLVGAFVTRALYYFPSLTVRPIVDPIAVIDRLDEFVIDVTQSPDGEIYVATAMGKGSKIRRLIPPPRGDCNGDGRADWRDFGALVDEIADGDGQPMVHAQNGAHAGSWGCDVNADSVIDTADVDELMRLVRMRRRAVRRW